MGIFIVTCEFTACTCYPASHLSVGLVERALKFRMWILAVLKSYCPCPRKKKKCSTVYLMLFAQLRWFFSPQLFKKNRSESSALFLWGLGVQISQFRHGSSFSFFLSFFPFLSENTFTMLVFALPYHYPFLLSSCPFFYLSC